MWGLVRGNGAGWGSAEVVASLAAGALLLAAFVAWERRAPTPMLPLWLFRYARLQRRQRRQLPDDRGAVRAVFFFAQFLQTVLGHGPLGAGLRLLPWTATLFFVAPVAGTLVDRFGERPFLGTGWRCRRSGSPGSR